MSGTHVTIGEASTLSGVAAKTIRYYEAIGLIRATQRSENSYRVYGQDDIATLRFVARARHLGFSIKEVKNLLELYRNKDRPSRQVKELALEHVARIEQRMDELASMRDAIALVAEQCTGDERPDCPILEELSTLKQPRSTSEASKKRSGFDASRL
jgi:MerR family copper efflux transcriptional regulator